MPSGATAEVVNKVYRKVERSGMTVERRKGVPSKIPKRTTYLGNIGANDQFWVHTTNLDDMERSIAERIFLVKYKHIPGFSMPHRPQKGVIAKRLNPFRQALLDAARINPVPCALEQFPMYYTGKKRTIYALAVASLMVEELTWRDALLKTFGKVEKYNHTVKADPVTRVINPRTPRYNARLGCYLKPIEHSVYDAINEVFGSVVVCKGLNAEERGELISEKWSQFKDPVAIGADAKRFDQHVSVQALRWEHGIYSSLYNNDEDLKSLLRMQLHNKGVVYLPEGRIKYECHGRRMSGDMNTAMGNVLLMSAMMKTYLDSRVSHYQFMNDGDDCVIIVERGALSRIGNLVSWFRGMGFEMELEPPVDCLEQVDFCQARPVQVELGKYIMVRNPYDCLSKDLLSYKSIDDEEAWNVRRKAIADCGLSLAGNVPVMWEFYAALLRGAEQAKVDRDPEETGMKRLARGMTRKYKEPSPCARESFYYAFNMLPETQISLEEDLRAVMLRWCSPPDIPNDLPITGIVEYPQRSTVLY